jgi:hypothetical protein
MTTDEKFIKYFNKPDSQVFRGIKRAIKNINFSEDFYYIDTGPFRLNAIKGHHSGRKSIRIIKNAFQPLNHYSMEKVVKILGEEYAFKKFHQVFHGNTKEEKRAVPKYFYKSFKLPEARKGKNILLCEDNHIKALGYSNEQWLQNVSDEIKKLSPDSKIIIREKPSPKERTSTRILADQLAEDNVKVVVTFSSFVGLHSIMQGVPAIMLGPSCADYLANKKLSDIHNPYYPPHEKIKEHLFYLANTQFNLCEIESGKAKEVVEALQGKNKRDPNTCLSKYYKNSMYFSSYS